MSRFELPVNIGHILMCLSGDVHKGGAAARKVQKMVSGYQIPGARAPGGCRLPTGGAGN